MSLELYKKTQRTTETSRQAEYRLFAQVTRALLEADKNGVRNTAYVDAIDWNRRMWSTFSTDCGLPGNGLPDQLRAQIISIALWVGRYSSEVILGNASMDALIDVNRAIMDGLAAQPQEAMAAQQVG
jgi:flagellar protein FlaF